MFRPHSSQPRPEQCQPCLRTCVSYVPGLYTPLPRGERGFRSNSSFPSPSPSRGPDGPRAGAGALRPPSCRRLPTATAPAPGSGRRGGRASVGDVGLAEEVYELASRADVVINTAPLTERPRGMFDAKFFTAMKSTAYFISVGRGASTITKDLVAALEEGKIAGAGLDVTDPEPLPQNHPLWTMPRVIISPHTGARSDKSRDRLFLLVQENLRRYVAVEPRVWVVDIERG